MGDEGLCAEGRAEGRRRTMSKESREMQNAWREGWNEAGGALREASELKA